MARVVKNDGDDNKKILESFKSNYIEFIESKKNNPDLFKLGFVPKNLTAEDINILNKNKVLEMNIDNFISKYPNLKSEFESIIGMREWGKYMED